MMTYDGYLAAWAAAHSFERHRLGPVTRAYLRLAYVVARPLARVPPDLVTLAALAAALGTVPLHAARLPALAALLVLASGLLDSVDGAVAAIGGRGTPFGAVWDSTADRLADVAFLAGPALAYPQARPALVAAGAGTFLLEYVRARCQAVGWTDRQVVTPGERPVRVVAVAAFSATGAWPHGGGWALAALTAVSVLLLLRDARARSTRPASG